MMKVPRGVRLPVPLEQIMLRTGLSVSASYTTTIWLGRYTVMV